VGEDGSGYGGEGEPGGMLERLSRKLSRGSGSTEPELSALDLGQPLATIKSRTNTAGEEANGVVGGASRRFGRVSSNKHREGGEQQPSGIHKYDDLGRPSVWQGFAPSSAHAGDYDVEAAGGAEPGLSWSRGSTGLETKASASGVTKGRPRGDRGRMMRSKSFVIHEHSQHHSDKASSGGVASDVSSDADSSSGEGGSSSGGGAGGGGLLTEILPVLGDDHIKEWQQECPFLSLPKDSAAAAGTAAAGTGAGVGSSSTAAGAGGGPGSAAAAGSARGSGLFSRFKRRSMESRYSSATSSAATPPAAAGGGGGGAKKPSSATRSSSRSSSRQRAAAQLSGQPLATTSGGSSSRAAAGVGSPPTAAAAAAAGGGGREGSSAAANGPSPALRPLRTRSAGMWTAYGGGDRGAAGAGSASPLAREASSSLARGRSVASPFSAPFAEQAVAAAAAAGGSSAASRGLSDANSSSIKSNAAAGDSSIKSTGTAGGEGLRSLASAAQHKPFEDIDRALGRTRAGEGGAGGVLPPPRGPGGGHP
jgi:hypothetical protein